MAGKSNSERLDDLESSVSNLDKQTAVHLTRLDKLDEDLKSTSSAQERAQSSVEELLRENAVLKRDVEELKRAGKELSDRFWRFLLPLAVMVVGAFLIMALGL